MIYGGHECDAISFENIPKALAEQGVDIRLFGKPQSFKKEEWALFWLMLMTFNKLEIKHNKQDFKSKPNLFNLCNGAIMAR